jgi:hypothetical protein
MEMGNRRSWKKVDAFERQKNIANKDFEEFDGALDDWLGDKPLDISGVGLRLQESMASGMPSLSAPQYQCVDVGRLAALETELAEKKDKLQRADSLTEGLLAKALELRMPRPPKVDEYINDLSSTAENSNRLLCDVKYLLRFKKEPETKAELTANDYETYINKSQTMLDALLVESKSLRGSMPKQIVAT